MIAIRESVTRVSNARCCWADIDAGNHSPQTHTEIGRRVWLRSSPPASCDAVSNRAQPIIP